MDVRAEQETAEGEREGGGYEEEEEEEGACWRSQSRQTGVLACMRGRRAGKLTGPVRVPQVTCLMSAARALQIIPMKAS